MKITDVRCAVLGESPVVRITTNEGICGHGQMNTAPGIYMRPYELVNFYRDFIIGEDPTDVERVMMKIRRFGSFKPWGGGVSAIEMALWDIAGKALNAPVYKLLGGKIRNKVRCYKTYYGVVHHWYSHVDRKDYLDLTTQDFRDWGAHVRQSSEGYTIVKQAVAFHSRMRHLLPNFYYGYKNPSKGPRDAPYLRGPLTETTVDFLVEYVGNMKEGLGDSIGLALDCGPGFMLSDAIRLAQAMEPYNLMWMEDMLTGDFTPYVMADDYRELTTSTSTPIHTGEQLYLRQNFRELIEKQAVRVLGPDPEDMGGIAEMKWVAEYADLHGIQFAPHGIRNGIFGLAAHVHAGAVMPQNYIAFEYPRQEAVWWPDIVEGIPDPIVKDGFVEVWDRPGLGIDFIVKEAKKQLSERDRKFFD